MQPAVVVTGVRASRLVRVPCEVANELDAEAVFVAANRIESPIKRDLANLTAKWQRDLRINLDRFGAPSMAPDDFIVIKLRAGAHVINGRVVRVPAPCYAIVECASIGWTITTTHDDLSLERQCDDHWLTLANNVPIKEPSV